MRADRITVKIHINRRLKLNACAAAAIIYSSQVTLIGTPTSNNECTAHLISSTALQGLAVA